MKKILCFLASTLLLCGCVSKTVNVSNYANSFSDVNRNKITMYYSSCLEYREGCLGYGLTEFSFSAERINDDFPSDVQAIIDRDNDMRLTPLKDVAFIFKADYVMANETEFNENNLAFMLDNGKAKIYVYFDGYVKIIDQNSDGINRYFYHTDAIDFNDNIKQIIDDITNYYQYYSEIKGVIDLFINEKQGG